MRFLKKYFFRSDWVIYSLVLLLLFNHVGNYWSATIFSKWSIFLMGASIVFSYHICKRIGLIFFPLLSYLLLSGIYTSFHPLNHLTQVGSILFRQGLERDGAYTLFCVLLGSLFLASFRKEWVRPIEKSLIFTCLLSLFYTFYKWKCVPFERGAFFSGNASMHACLIAGLFPFVLQSIDDFFISPRKWQILATGVALVAIVMTDSRVGVGLLAVSLTSYWLVLYRFSWPLLVSCISGSTFIFLVGKYFSVKNYLDSGGRYIKWIQVYDWWSTHASNYFGWGLGGTFHWGSYVNMLHANPGEQISVFMWMHNDWLQTLFDLGWVGLFFTCLSYLYLLIKCRKNAAIFSSLLSFGAMGLFNYPLRLPIHATAILCIIGLGLTLKERRITHGN